MAGTVDGGRKAATTNKERYGANFYVKIGAKGGGSIYANTTNKGFGHPNRRHLASELGKLGGQTSQRRKREA